MRELATGSSLWVLLLLLSPLIGYSFIQAVALYAEASRPALSIPELAPAFAVRRHPGPDLWRVLSGDHAALSVHCNPAHCRREGERRPQAAGTTALSADRPDRREIRRGHRRLANCADPPDLGAALVGTAR